MSETAKSRESTAPQEILKIVIDFRSSLASLLEEERRRLRRIPSEDFTAAPDPEKSAPIPLAVADHACRGVATRVEAAVDREPSAAMPVNEASVRLSRISIDREGFANGASSSRVETEASRPENPRKRLDELAKLLDRRAKQSAESVLKGSEPKEAER